MVTERQTSANAKVPLSKPERRRRRRRRHLRVLVWVIGILVIARIVLPYVVLYLANNKLASLEGYYGHIEDIDISLYNGSYTIKQLQLKKLDKNDTFDFIYAHRIDLAVEWPPLWEGDLVGKVAIDSSVLVYTVERNDWRDLAKDTANFRDVMNAFMPLTLNKLTATHSTIIYRNPYASHELDMKLTNIDVTALNLVNAYDSTSLLPSTIDGKANLYKGALEVHMKIDPFADQSKFDLNASLKHVKLVSMNSLLRAYANLDVNSGDFEAYMEFATKNGKLNGYVKPLISNLDIVSWNKKEGKLGQILYESMIEAGAWLFKNHRTDQIGSKIYIHGDLKNPRVSIGKAIILLLQNAFIATLKPYIDGDIDIGMVSGGGQENAIDRFIEKRRDRKQEKAAKKRRRKAR
jgi:hypothetical protein